MYLAQAPARRLATLVVAIALAVAPGVPAADAAGPAPVGVPVTYEGPSYPSVVTRPSESKPQSKLWYTDGSWWALMVTGASTSVRIHQLMPDHTWRDTGAVVDTRLNSTGDALWSAADGKLYVASRSKDTSLQVARFSYSVATGLWAVDAGFPVAVDTGGGSESATIDQDSTGQLWVTYTRASRLWVAVSAPGGETWSAGFAPNVPDVVISSDDISGLIAFQGNIGVLWSDQQSQAFRFAIHHDGDPLNEWAVETVLPGATWADDHINLKQVAGDAQGRVFAAVKTSNDLLGPDAPLVGVLVRTPQADGTGSWEFVVAGTVADDHTRPIIMIDQTNGDLYFFATAPGAGGDIYYKRTSLANPNFGPGRGDKFVDTAYLVNNASGSKDPVTAKTGLVVLAVEEGRKRYAHAEMALAGGDVPPPDSTPPTVPSDVTAVAQAGRVDLSWTASTDDTGVTGYTVRRDDGATATVTGTTYSDTTVTSGSTYQYTVEAFDANGNTSASSAVVSATVPSDPVGSGIAFRSSTTAANNAAATLTIGVPSVEVGDVLIGSVDFRGQPTVTPPAGWTLIRQDNNGTVIRKATYYHGVTATPEPGSYTWRFSTKPAAVGSILAYSGVSTSAPVMASSGQANAGSKSVTAPSVTTTGPAVVVGLFGVNKGTALAPPADMVERTEIRSAATVRYPLTAEAADLIPGVGATGPKVATSTTSGASIGQLVALNPAG